MVFTLFCDAVLIPLYILGPIPKVAAFASSWYLMPQVWGVADAM